MYVCMYVCMYVSIYLSIYLSVFIIVQYISFIIDSLNRRSYKYSQDTNLFLSSYFHFLTQENDVDFFHR